jgi:5-methylcytosine-specific restriction endonuclease McrA
MDRLRLTKRWRELRLRVLRKQPFCARCDRNVSEIADHIVPAAYAVMQAQQSGKFFDPYAGYYFESNVQGLCRSCHTNKTQEDKAHIGPWPDVIAKEDKVQSGKVWSF